MDDNCLAYGTEGGGKCYQSDELIDPNDQLEGAARLRKNEPGPLHWEEIAHGTFRLRVFGGWLVRVFRFNQGFVCETNTVFVPDEHGHWIPGKVNRTGDMFRRDSK